MSDGENGDDASRVVIDGDKLPPRERNFWGWMAYFSLTAFAVDTAVLAVYYWQFGGGEALIRALKQLIFDSGDPQVILRGEVGLGLMGVAAWVVFGGLALFSTLRSEKHVQPKFK